MRRLLHGDRALRAGYVEGVAVREDRQGRGHGAGMMAELERIIRGAYDLGALGATEVAVPFYRGRGWRPWRGETWALTATGPVRTPEEDGWIYVLPAAAALDLGGSLICGIRPGEAW